ncbi:MAG: hypothetical protein LBU88_06780 [Treponema sp.]|jgi:hypothetical protein|nr:hypothetical protein [Treponema sp.]
MLQLYFLSILCNSLCGYILFTGSEDQDVEKSIFSLNNPTFHLVLGIISTVTGILKLLSPIGEKHFFFGDLIPAAAGIIAGFLLIFGIYRQDTYALSESHKTLDNFAAKLLSIRKPLGLGLLAAAALHFLFPGALFL